MRIINTPTLLGSYTCITSLLGVIHVQLISLEVIHAGCVTSARKLYTYNFSPGSYTCVTYQFGSYTCVASVRKLYTYNFSSGSYTCVTYLFGSYTCVASARKLYMYNFSAWKLHMRNFSSGSYTCTTYQLEVMHV